MIEAPSLALPRTPRTNPIRSRVDWETQRSAFLQDPGAFHGAIARSTIHWYDAELHAWIIWDAAALRWTGFHASTGQPVEVQYGAEYQPWKRTFNADDPPFYHWFEGGLTNACFNELDRHVMMGFGDETAYIFEGDRWDNSLNGGRGGPVTEERISWKKLLFEVIKASLVLTQLGVKQGDRIALNMPNILDQLYYTQAAKRLGILYTPVFGGFSDKTLSDRIHNAGAQVVITSDGAYRNAQIVPYKEVYTDRALDTFVPVESAIAIVEQTLATLQLAPAATDVIVATVKATIAEDITVERSDVMRGVGKALQALSNLDVTTQAQIRTAVAKALVDSPARVKTVVVVRHTGQDILWRPERDRWSHDLKAIASEQICSSALAQGISVSSEEELLNLPLETLLPFLMSVAPCTPVDAEYPMFIIYTSGSTGKPKGVVHVHGGYLAGLVHTMKVSFDAEPGDRIFVVADPGWITGQSYMLSATMASRCTGILIEGSPVFPSAGRFASMIERYGVQIFKAGVTFLKSVMTNPQNIADVRRYDMSTLRVCTFCAEPVSPAVQQFGMEVMSPHYINSYWATEHGGIVWTHFYANDDYPLRPDAHTYPLPWIAGDVWVAETGPNGTHLGYRVAEMEEKGEIVITAPYPYLARTIWGDVDGFEATLRHKQPLHTWRGDAERFIKT